MDEQHTLDAALQVVKAKRWNRAATFYRKRLVPCPSTEKQEALQAKYLAEQRWVRYVLVSPANRLLSFIKIQQHLSDYLYWRLLGHIWRKYADTSNFAGLWNSLFLMPLAGCEAFMRAKDRDAYARLPEEIKAYRGFAPGHREGFNYTLNPHVAMFFAAMHDDGECVVKLLPKRDCFFCGNWLKQIVYVPGLGDVQDSLLHRFSRASS